MAFSICAETCWHLETWHSSSRLSHHERTWPPGAPFTPSKPTPLAGRRISCIVCMAACISEPSPTSQSPRGPFRAGSARLSTRRPAAFCARSPAAQAGDGREAHEKRERNRTVGPRGRPGHERRRSDPCGCAQACGALTHRPNLRENPAPRLGPHGAHQLGSAADFALCPRDCGVGVERTAGPQECD